ncbi:hypothetical protein PoB_004794300 [Plakobranchus ocellatus]|uniref:Uncharacterized protein n=1 Tax=Plakobranchus ocellatus TaxID=259542 RepID=A0AAV4BQP0_9GAST|nr:hypothetical protein PoB_004794300 [Plakobranchus ocellatus]
MAAPPGRQSAGNNTLIRDEKITMDFKASFLSHGHHPHHSQTAWLLFKASRVHRISVFKLLIPCRAKRLGGLKLAIAELVDSRVSPFVTVPPVYFKLISGFQALRQAMLPVVGLQPATKASQQISRRNFYPLCHQSPP